MVRGGKWIRFRKYHIAKMDFFTFTRVFPKLITCILAYIKLVTCWFNSWHHLLFLQRLNYERSLSLMVKSLRHNGHLLYKFQIYPSFRWNSNIILNDWLFQFLTRFGIDSSFNQQNSWRVYLKGNGLF